MNQDHRHDWLNKRKERAKWMKADKLLPLLVQGDRVALGKALTLVESAEVNHQREARSLLMQLPKKAALRIGITGVPGVGKSSFIEVFGQLLVERGFKVAVLAIDPTSRTTGGSILGDKTRMQNLSVMPDVFIRPSAAGKTLGGVARKTFESIHVCEAAGYDVILVETVGVGQSETMVAEMVDFLLVLMLAGAGDELQGIKRGIMELADALVITKADGDNKLAAKRASREYQNAMHLFPARKNGWVPKALTCSSLTRENIDGVLEEILSYQDQTKSNGHWHNKRMEQQAFWFEKSVESNLLETVLYHKELEIMHKQLLEAVEDDRINLFEAIDQMLVETLKWWNGKV